MTTATTTSASLAEQQAHEPEHSIASLQQDKGQNLYYQQHIYRAYKDSAESNQDLDIAWNIFEHAPSMSEYQMFKLASLLHDIGYIPLSSELSIITDQLDYLMRDMQAMSLWPSHEHEEEAEEQLFVHDAREQGFTMNWKRARELYKRLFQE